MKVALLLVIAAGCVRGAGTSPAGGDDDTNDHGTSDANGSGSNDCTVDAGPDLCAAEPDVKQAFAAWAAVQPTSNSVGNFQYRLDAIIEPGPEPVFAVSIDLPVGNQYSEDKYVIALDANGAERARAPGRYIDHLAPGAFLIDKAWAHVNYIPFHDGMYGVGMQLYAADRNGTALWHVMTPGTVAERSNVYRAGDHWLVVGLTTGNSDPTLTYFDATGQVTPPVAGDTRACVTPQT